MNSVFTLFQDQLNSDTYIEKYDENEALRAVKLFYEKHSEGQVQVFILTSQNQQIAQHEFSSESLITEETFEQLKQIIDFASFDDFKQIFQPTIEEQAIKQLDEHYTEYISNPEEALHRLQVLSGVIKTAQRGKSAYIVSSQGIMVKCPSRICINRALDRDHVVFRIFKPDVPLEQIQQCNNIQDQMLFPLQDGIYQNVKELLGNSNEKLCYAYVVGLLQRSENIFCGTLKQPFSFKINNESRITIDVQKSENINYSVFVPINYALPNFLIKSTQDMRRFIGHRLSCQFLEWPTSYGIGTVVLKEDIGNIGNLDVEARAICIDHGIDDSSLDTKQNLINELPTSLLNDEGNIDRIDLTNISICSIDPPGCKDIDDAVHCILLEDTRYNTFWKSKEGIFPGLQYEQYEKQLDSVVDDLQSKQKLYEVGVHIADVTHYVKQGSQIDLIAQKRGTTVYLPDRRIDLLPKLLTEDVCSLVDRGPRYTFSFLCLMDLQGNLYKYKFSKAKIKNMANLTYYEAWSILTTPEGHRPEIREEYADELLLSKLAASLRPLFAITKELRRKRYASSALTLESPELDFSLDQDNNPVAVEEHKKVPTMELIEELMLLCNVHAAVRVHAAFRTTAVLRRHEKPAEHSFIALKQQLSKHGIELDVSDTKAIRKSLDTAGTFKDTAYKLLIRCLKLAKYVAAGSFSKDDLQHYGLALDIYTHFTSPIRRYADQLVHRQLYAAITGQPLPDYLMGQQSVEKICQNLNERKEEADRASRDADKFFVSLLLIRNLLTNQNQITYEAIVQDIMEKQVSVALMSLGIEITIPKEKNDYGANKESFTFRGKEYKVLDIIQLQIMFDTEHPWDFKAKIRQ